MDHYILAVNPGSTSTKLAVYKNEELLFKESIIHPQDEIDFFEDFYDQHNFRKMVVMNTLENHGFDINLLSCVVGRGGMLPPVKVGGYKVNDRMIEYLRNLSAAPHAANLGCMIAKEIGDSLNIPAYIYDALSACTLPPESLVMGIPEVEKITFCHVLNSRAAALKYAKDNGKNYNDVKVVVAHLGGGISVSAHYKGKIVDVAGDDDGPMSPERSGMVPLIPVINLCYEGRYSRMQMNKKVRGNGGIKAYLGTSNMIDVEKMVKDGDEKANLVCKAMLLQVSKAIGSVASSVKGDVDAIILTGGMAYSEMFTSVIKEYVSYIAPVLIYPGENELEALAMGSLRILKGEEEAYEFTF